MANNDQNKQKLGLKTKKVRAVVINPTAWNILVGYVSDMPIAFGNAKRAAEVQDILASVQLMDIEMPDTEPEKDEKTQ